MNDAMPATVNDLLDAVRLIAEERTPCWDCGKPHELRDMPSGLTWADPLDNHSYRPMSASNFAQQVLDGQGAA